MLLLLLLLVIAGTDRIDSIAAAGGDSRTYPKYFRVLPITYQGRDLKCVTKCKAIRAINDGT